MEAEKKEALMRIPVGIVAGIILELWGLVILVLALFHFFYVLFTGKRKKAISEFSNQYIGFAYSSLRYMTFTVNKRPFPFDDMQKPLEKVDMKNL